MDFLREDLISDINDSNFSANTTSISAFNKRYDPPFKSKPRFIFFPGKKLNELFCTELPKKLGAAYTSPKNTLNSIRIILILDKLFIYITL